MNKLENGTGSSYTGHLLYPAPSTGTIIGDKCEAEIDVLAKQCEICGRKTNGIHEHICGECKERLNKLLYE